MKRAIEHVAFTASDVERIRDNPTATVADKVSIFREHRIAERHLRDLVASRVESEPAPTLKLIDLA